MNLEKKIDSLILDLQKNKHNNVIEDSKKLIKKNQDNWEKLILLQEKLASQPANFVGISPDFLVDKPQDIVIESTQRWAARQDSLIRLIETGRKETSVLNGKIDSLNSSIKQQQIRLSAMVENFQRDLQKRKDN